MSKNKELLDKLMSGDSIAVEGDPADNNQNNPAPEPKKVETKDGDELEIPEYVPSGKAKGRAPEESVAILRKQRDEARQRIEEQEALLKEKEELLGKSTIDGSVFDEVKKLINKEEVTTDDLKQIFKDYDFTKKEKEALANQLKETQERLKDYDIRQSPEFIENYERPILDAQQALAAEIVPIVNGKPVMNKDAAEIMRELVDSGEINAQTVKIAITRIRDAYEDAGVDYDMPSVKNVLSCLNSVVDLHSEAAKAYQNWEETKIQKSLEKQEIDQSKQTIIKAKSRQERVVIAKGYMAKLAQSDDYEYIADMYGHENAMQVAVSSHNDLSEMMDDPSKAPTYDTLLDLMTKARLFDKMINEKVQSSKLADVATKKAKVESIGQKPDRQARDTNPNKELLKSMGVSFT
jgi:hypothetical protein